MAFEQMICIDALNLGHALHKTGKGRNIDYYMDVNEGCMMQYYDGKMSHHISLSGYSALSAATG